jgi:putative ABC transport system substrate-binding protein
MLRRELITLLGGAAAAFPFAVRAEQPTIGFLSLRSPEDSERQVAAFRRGLAESRYVEVQTVTIEYRWGRGQSDQLPAMAAELARRSVALIVAGTEPAALAAKAATSTIPIVFVIGSDPVKLGLVASINRPGGNATGFNILTNTLEAKRLGLLHELVPRTETIGVLVNPGLRASASQLDDVQQAAAAIGLKVDVLQATTDSEIDAAFDVLDQRRIGALVVSANSFFDTRREKIVALAASHAVPVIYQFREFITSGGLISYGVDLADVYRQVSIYAGRILKGEKPADLPVVQPTKFELVLNLKTARTLSLTIPPGVLAITDEVIE